jgi:hypothetical protein
MRLSDPSWARGWRSWLRFALNYTSVEAWLQGDQDFLTISLGGRLARLGGVMLSREHVTVDLLDGVSRPAIRFESDDDDRVVFFYNENAELIADRLRVMGWRVFG